MNYRTHRSWFGREAPKPKPKQTDELTQVLQFTEAVELIGAQIVMWREPLANNPEVDHIHTLDLHALRN